MGVWDRLSSDLLDSVKGFLEVPEAGDHSLLQLMKTLRLVNRHWSRWATTATTMLKPGGQHIKLKKLVEVISQQFVNLNTLDLDRMMNTPDDGLSCLSTLPNLTYLSLSGKYTTTNAGVRHFWVLQCLRGLSLKCCQYLTDVGIKELASLTALTKL